VRGAFSRDIGALSDQISKPSQLKSPTNLTARVVQKTKTNHRPPTF